MSDYSTIRIQAQRQAMFETPVVLANLSGGETLIEDLKRVIAERRASDPDGVQRSNIGGWHSDTRMTDWGASPARFLAEKAIAMAKRLSFFEGTSHDQYEWMVQMWANITPPGGSNHIHVHPGNLWSAVLYVDLGGADPTAPAGETDGGEFYFEDPRFPTGWMHHTSFRFVGQDGQPQAINKVIRPRAGDFLMFPSWLRHGVRPYTGVRERISIALNVDVARRWS